MPRPGVNPKRVEIEDRRRKVGQLYLAGVRQQEIARQLGISQQTVSLDIKAIREEWRLERVEILDREVLSLDEIERECAVRYAQDRDGQWLDRRLKVKDRRARLLGLDAPVRQETSGPSGGPIQHEHTHTIPGIREKLLDELAAVAERGAAGGGAGADDG